MQLFCKVQPSMAPGKDGPRKSVMLLEGRLGTAAGLQAGLFPVSPRVCPAQYSSPLRC